VDMTHWYHAVYHEPFESVSNFILRHIAEWQAACGRDGLVWASQSGSLPKMALPSLIFASSELMAARSLPLAQRLNIIRWVNHLWLGCAFSGAAPTSSAGSAVPILSGAVDLKVRDRLKQPVWLPIECSNHPLTKISPQYQKPYNIVFSWSPGRCIRRFLNFCSDISAYRECRRQEDSPMYRSYQVGILIMKLAHFHHPLAAT
jgi:hypothetical protein